MHRAIYKALEGDMTAYMQTRVYYLVFICDHHFSVAYGRPPMTHECDSIRAATKMLSLPHATQDDARLISQANIWTISTKVFDTFGTDVSSPLDVKQLPQLRRLNIALETWRADWIEAFNYHDHVGNYPAKGVGLHFHFAKLYLCSHAFRGMTESNHVRTVVDPEIVEIMTTALNSAIWIVRTVNTDTEIQSHFNGLPLYFDTMTAFAAVFLLKVIRSFSGILRLDVDDLLSLVEGLADTLKRSTACMHRWHLLADIANSLHKAVDKVRRSIQEGREHGRVSMPEDSSEFVQNMGTIGNVPWFDSPDGLFFQNFDFLSAPNVISGFENQDGYYNFQQ